jgi:uncharacterized coiled-coil DUF342 family protein
VDDLTSALIAVAIIIVTGVGGLVKIMLDHIAEELKRNTSLTTQARDASNGRLSEVIDKLAASRDQVQGLRWLVRERDDRIAYIVARLPEAEGLMREYRDRRDSRITQADELVAEQHAMGTEGSTPSS